VTRLDETKLFQPEPSSYGVDTLRLVLGHPDDSLGQPSSPCHGREKALRYATASCLRTNVTDRYLPARPTATATATGVAASAATGAAFGTSFVHFKRAAVKVLGVQFLDSLETFFTISHFDESESSGSAGELVNNDLGGIYFPVALKQALEIAFVGIEGQVSDVNINSHLLAPLGRAPDTIWEGAFAVTNKGLCVNGENPAWIRRDSPRHGRLCPEILILAYRP